MNDATPRNDISTLSTEEQLEAWGREFDEITKSKPVVKTVESEVDEIPKQHEHRSVFDVYVTSLGKTVESEVDEMLKRHGVTRDEVSTADEPHPFDDLKEQADFAVTPTFDEKPTPLPDRDLNSVAQNLTTTMVPGFGEELRRYDIAALSQYGFPPAIDELITRVKLDDYRISIVLDAYQKAFQIADKWEKEAFAIVVTDESQTDRIEDAKRRYKLVQSTRIAGEKVRKEMKEPALREGQLIDGVAKIWSERIAPIEKHLKKQADFALEREKERQQKLAAERWEKLKLFVDKAPASDLGKMSAEEFELLYRGAVAAWEEKESLARAEEARRQQELADALANAERHRLENERLAIERKAAADREAEANRIADEQRAKAEEATRELARQEAARKEEQDRLKREEEIKRLAPDKDKLLRFADELASFAVPEVSEPKAIEVANYAEGKVIELVKTIREMVAAMP